MEALRGLKTNVPDWVRRLDDLSGQIDQRQLDLAKFAENQPPSPPRSLRNRGSTESLKPKEDGAAFPSDEQPREHAQNTRPAAPSPSHPIPQVQAVGQSLSSRSRPKSPPATQRQTNEIMAAARKRVRATVQKRVKTESMISAEGVVPQYRTRSMIIVYYDSYIQSFFEELVKFVSASRNMMRKAKMAAKVAEIKRLAELEMPNDDDDDDDDDDNDDGDELQLGDALIAADPKLMPAKPRGGNDDTDFKLHYISTRQMGPATRIAGGLVPLKASGGPGVSISQGGLGLFNQGGGDIYDELDRGLEFVQSSCEHAAHQFLRDGECGEEIEKIKKKLEQTRGAAEKEMERILKENPDALNEPDPPKMRSYRPMSMRRDPLGAYPKARAMLEVDDEGVSDLK